MLLAAHQEHRHPEPRSRPSGSPCRRRHRRFPVELIRNNHRPAQQRHRENGRLEGCVTDATLLAEIKRKPPSCYRQPPQRPIPRRRHQRPTRLALRRAPASAARPASGASGIGTSPSSTCRQTCVRASADNTCASSAAPGAVEHAGGPRHVLPPGRRSCLEEAVGCAGHVDARERHGNCRRTGQRGGDRRWRCATRQQARLGDRGELSGERRVVDDDRVPAQQVVEHVVGSLLTAERQGDCGEAGGRAAIRVASRRTDQLAARRANPPRQRSTATSIPAALVTRSRSSGRATASTRHGARPVRSPRASRRVRPTSS